jgi:hypothetical protein
LLPRYISYLNRQININITRINNLKPEALRESCIIFKKIEQCTDIKTITACLGGYLQAYAKIAERWKIVEGCSRPNYQLL